MTLPASTAEQFLYYADGHYHYSAFCCNKADPHYAVISSTSQISPLGCGSNQPPTPIVITPLPEPAPIGPKDVQLEAPAEESIIFLQTLDRNDYRSSALVGTTPTVDNVVSDHPTSIAVSVQIPLFRFSAASMIDARLKQRSFRLMKVVKPTIAGSNPVRQFPMDIYFADWCRALPTDPSAILQVTGSNQRQSFNGPTQGNIYRLTITQGVTNYEAWLVFRTRVTP
jgi:hypothetical protein